MKRHFCQQGEVRNTHTHTHTHVSQGRLKFVMQGSTHDLLQSGAVVWCAVVYSVHYVRLCRPLNPVERCQLTGIYHSMQEAKEEEDESAFPEHF